MTDDEQAPQGLDVSVPNMARMYDYALGGKDNYAIDRETADRMFAAFPALRELVVANRGFLQRAVRFLARATRFAAEQGIAQFLDLGSGLPSQGNVHEVARQVRPDARVVYVDNDPMAALHAASLLAGHDDAIAVVQEDIRNYAKVLGHPDTLRLIDFSQPVVVLFVSVLHSIPDADEPGSVIRAFARRMVPGSYLILSHLTSDGHPAELVRQKEEVFAKTPTPFSYRSRAQILGYFDGFELVEPGLTPVTQWRAEPLDEKLQAAGEWWLGGVGRKP